VSSGESVAIYIVPHTHWDREWYEPFQVFRAQLVDLWDELLMLTERDPEFHFLMDGQTVVVDDYLAIRPEASARVERAVGSGQIQVGPWYTLPDEFLVSGETLVRNLQRGIADGDRHGGAMRAGYLPDSFGHTAQMPQIYRQLGFRHAVVWRGVPSAIDRVAFVWEAPDGSRILTAYMGRSYSNGVDLPLDGPGLAARLSTALRQIAPFDPGASVLLMNGNDHVLPQARLTAAVKSASELLGVPARLSRLDEYLETLPEEGWPRWQGELRSSARANVLMGTLSVRIPDKLAYFEAGLRLERLAEPMSSLSGFDAGGLLGQAWTLVLQNAAHDTACGSGVDAVARESRLRSEAAAQIAAEVARRAAIRLRVLAPAGPAPESGAAFAVWNPSPFPRDDLIEVRLAAVPPGGQDLGTVEALRSPERQRFPAEEISRLLSFLDERRISGQPVRALRFTRDGSTVRLSLESDPMGTPADLEEARGTVERLAAEPGVEVFELTVVESEPHRVLIQPASLPGCGLGRIVPLAARPVAAEAAVRAGGSSLRSDRLTCELQGDGTLTVHHLLTDTRYQGILRLVDQGDGGDEYTFSPVGEPTVLEPLGGAQSRFTEVGPLRASLEMRARYRIPSGLLPSRRERSREEVDLPVCLRLSLATGRSRLDCEMEFENHASDHRLRLEFPLPFDADRSQADGAFHVIGRRAIEAAREAGAPEWELPTYPMRSFVDASDGSTGLTLIGHGLHEYELIPGPRPRLALTILRAVGWLSRDDLLYRTGHAGPPMETPEAQLQGRHGVRFSLFFHASDWEAGGCWREAERALLPLQLLGPAPSGPGREASQAPSISIEPETVQMTACVPGASGYELRLFNACPRQVEARIAMTPRPAEVLSVSLGGEVERTLPVSDGGVRLPLGGWRIATLRVSRSGRSRA
jgi:alpha-mannosidase